MANAGHDHLVSPLPAAPTREKVGWAIRALGRASRQELIGAVMEQYPEGNEGTVADHVNALTVNYPSRVYSPMSNKTRAADDPRYDLLFRELDKTFVSFDPATQGQWEIAKDGHGAWVCEGLVRT